MYNALSGTSMFEALIYTQPGYLFRRAHQLCWGAFIEETKSLGITPVQYAALVAIATHPGIDATRISQLISYDRATIGNVLDRLEKKGLLTRTSHAGDRRTKQTFLTAEGKQTIKAVKRATSRIAERILCRLDTLDRRKLMQLLSQLLGIDQPKAATAEHVIGLPRPKAPVQRAGDRAKSRSTK
jgi:MarR family transcriptional regulator, lower aerobic nicotinate degradation pathway regulator